MKLRDSLIALFALSACASVCPAGGEREPRRVEIPAVASVPEAVAPRSAPPRRRIASGARHVCYASTAGRVLCWGSNRDGELGRGTSTWGEPRPASIPGLDDATEVAAGDGSTCALHRTGRVSCWGSLMRATSPRTVPEITSATGIAVDGADGCAALRSGDVVCWGSNVNGRMGAGDTRGGRADAPGRVPGLTQASAVRMSRTLTCALTESGEVWCWGRMGSQIVLPKKIAGLEGIVEISLAYSTVLARRNDRRVFVFAAPRRGPIVGPEPVPELDLGGDVTLLGDRPCQIDKEGEIGCRGGKGKPVSELTRLPSARLGRAIQVDSDDGLTCAIHTDGTAAEQVSCWGSNEHGQLGLGDIIGARTRPVARSMGATSVRVTHSGGCALEKGGGVTCWGGGDFKNRPVDGASNVQRLLESPQFGGMCGQAKDVDLVCWSLSGTRTATPVAGVRGVIDQARYAGEKGEFVYAILKGSLHAWRLNPETRRPEVKPIAGGLRGISGLVRVDADSHAVCVLDKAGKAACATPADPFGDDPKHTWLAVQASSKLREISVSAGARVCGLEENGDVSCFGENDLPVSGPLRLVPQRAFSPAVRFGRGDNLCAQGKDDVVRCSIGLDARGSGHGDQIHVAIDFGPWKEIVGLSTSSSLVCGWTRAGEVLCAGTNDDGQLGIADPIRVTEPHAVALPRREGGDQP